MEQREEFVRDWPQLPDDHFKQYLLDWEFRGDKGKSLLPDSDMAAEIVDWMEMLHNIDDAVCVCAGMSSFCLKPPYHIHNYPKLISAATGMDIDEAGLKKIVNRSRNLHRAFNNRRGMTRADEKPPAGSLEEEIPRDRRDSFCPRTTNSRGGIKDGIPTRRKLEELGSWPTLPTTWKREGY